MRRRRGHAVPRCRLPACARQDAAAAGASPERQFSRYRPGRLGEGFWVRAYGGGVRVGRPDDDRPFIVLTETKPSKRHIPVWARYSPLY